MIDLKWEWCGDQLAALHQSTSGFVAALAATPFYQAERRQAVRWFRQSGQPVSARMRPDDKSRAISQSLNATPPRVICARQVILVLTVLGYEHARTTLFSRGYTAYVLLDINQP